MTVGSNKLYNFRARFGMSVPHSVELWVRCFGKRQSDVPKQSRVLMSQLTSVADWRHNRKIKNLTITLMTQLLRDSIILCHLQVSPNNCKQCCLQPCRCFSTRGKLDITQENVLGGGGILIEIIRRISHLKLMIMVTTCLGSELTRMNTMWYGDENLDTS